MSVGGETRPRAGQKPARRNWARVVASWFVVFFIVASWSILFRTFSPLLFGGGHHREMVLSMAADGRGDLCIIPLGAGLDRSLADGRNCEVGFSAS